MKNTTIKTVKTAAQLKAMQIKAMKVAETLSKEVIIADKGEQHIQAKSGIAYELSVKDGKENFDVIAKKVGDDLEVTLEDSVVIFDDYFTICSTDLSCLVSLPAENGLYHVVDTFVTLEDGTQLVYFYGDETFISSNSSVTSESFSEAASSLSSTSMATLGLLAGAVALGGGGAAGDIGTTITGFFSAGKYVSGGDDAVTVMKADGSGDELGTGSLKDDGSYTITFTGENANYTGPVYVKLADTVMHKDEATDINKEVGTPLFAVAVIGSGTTTININVQTTIAYKVAGGNPDTAVDKTVIDNANKLTQEALGLDSNILTTKIDTINSQGDESGSKKAGYMAGALSGYAGGFVAAIAEISADIKDKGALDSTTAGKLVTGLTAVNTKMAAEVATITTDVATKATAVTAAQDAVTAAQTAVDADDGTDADALATLNTTLAAAKETLATAEEAYKIAVAKLAEYKEYAVASQDSIGDFADNLKANVVAIKSIDISDDNGKTDADFITNEADQTITATLDADLTTGQKLWYSVDDGATWKDTEHTTAKGTTVSFDATLNEGSSRIQLAITGADATATSVKTDKIGAVAQHFYTLDTRDSTVESVVISATNSADVAKTDTLMAGDKVIVSIIMSEVVIVTANEDTDKPTYEIMVGANARVATYVSGSGTDTLKFAYIIVNNETDDAGGITADTNKLTLKNTGTITDIAGNAANLDSPAATTNTITVDTQAPDAPSNLALATSDDTGSSDDDNITNKTIVTITGKAEAGATVELFNGSTSLGTTTANSSGVFNKEVTLTAGSTGITAKATDAAGNVSAPTSTALSVTVDTTDPAFSSNTASSNAATNADITTVVYDASATDNGGANDENITYSITGGANAALFKFKDAAAGQLTYKAVQKTEATHVVEITATDTAGNTATQTVTIYAKDFSTSVNWAGATTDDYINASEKSAATLSGSIVGGADGSVTIEKIEIFKDGTKVSGADIASAEVELTGRNWALKSSAMAKISSLGDGIYTAKVTIKDGDSSPITSDSKAVTYDSSASALTSIAITSDAGTDKTYKAGDTIEITVTMSEDTIVAGDPRIALLSGKYATYASGSGSNKLIFTYTVATGDTDANGLAIVANALNLNGGTLTDTAGNTAVITHAAVADNADHMIDTTPPVFSSGNTGAGVVGQDIVAYDAEVDGGDSSVTYAISGTDMTKFNLDTDTGVVTYIETPTVKSTTADQITITATDVAGNKTEQTVSISVVDKPVASSTINEAQNIDVRSPIVLTFSEIVTANSNFNIVLTDTNDSDGDSTNGVDGVGWKSDTTQNNQTIAVDSNMVTIKNVDGKSIVTIDPRFDFDFATHYTISIGAGAFTGTASTQESAAISMSFDTVTPKDYNPDIDNNRSTQSKIQVAGTDMLADSNWWVSAHQGAIYQNPLEIAAGLDKDIAVAVSMAPNTYTQYAGHVALMGDTDINDVIYLDHYNGEMTIPSSVSKYSNDLYDQYNWSTINNNTFMGKKIDGTIGVIENNVGTGVAYEEANDKVYSDALLKSEEHGAVLHG